MLASLTHTSLSHAQYSEAVERMKAFGSGLRALGMTPQPDIKDFNQAVSRLPSRPPPTPRLLRASPLLEILGTRDLFGVCRPPLHLLYAAYMHTGSLSTF